MRTIAILALCAAAWGQQADIKVLQVRDNIYMLVGAGGNVAVQTGKDGVFVVDTGATAASPKLLAEIKKLSPLPIRYIVNTHFDPNHSGGNEAIRKAGATIAGGNVSGDIQDAAEGAALIAHENVLNRMSARSGGQAIPTAAWPTSTFFDEKKKVYFNGEGIEVIHQPAAHSDGDTIVFFRRSDVIVAGDILTINTYPVIDTAAGGTYQGLIDAMNRVIDMIIPVYGQEGGTLVIPGDGRLCDFGDVLNYREMATIVKDRIEDMIKKGMTLEQVKAARPTRDYDPLYGSSRSWTADQFVTAAYNTLKARK